MTDKEIELLKDATEEEYSNCCGYEIMQGYCVACGEHCK